MSEGMIDNCDSCSSAMFPVVIVLVICLFIFEGLKKVFGRKIEEEKMVRNNENSQ